MTWPAPSLKEKGCPRSRLLSNCTSQLLLDMLENVIHFTVEAGGEGSVTQPLQTYPDQLS